MVNKKLWALFVPSTPEVSWLGLVVWILFLIHVSLQTVHGETTPEHLQTNPNPPIRKKQSGRWTQIQPAASIGRGALGSTQG